MFTSKLLRFIQALEKPELDRFAHFLDSPYFRKNKPVPEIFLLLQHISSCFPDLEDERLSKEHTYAIVYPDQDFIAGKLDRVMSNLLKMMEDFIVYEFSDLRDNQVQRLLIMAKFYRQRRMEKSFLKTIKLLRDIQQKAQKDKAYYLNQFFIEQEVADYESFYNHRNRDYNVPATLRSLDIFYLIHKLEYTCWLLAQNKYNIPLNLKENMLTSGWMVDSYKEEVPLIKVYDRGINLLKSEDDNDDTFRELAMLLEQHSLEIPIERLKELQALCRNYCITEYNKGRASFLEEVFSLYRDHLEQGYLLYEGGLLPSTIRGIVVFGLRLKKYDWVYQFLQEYKDRIVGTNQADEIYLFNMAVYYFAIKEYAQALDCLADRYEDSYYLIAAKRIELKIYYELRYEILESKINAFKIYIYRISQKALPAIQREGNNNFIDVLKQIQSPKTLDNIVRIEKLINKVRSKKSIAEKEWLLEKLLLLKK